MAGRHRDRPNGPRVAPNALIVVGGPHMSIYAKESLSWDCFDVAIVGDGKDLPRDL